MENTRPETVIEVDKEFVGQLKFPDNKVIPDKNHFSELQMNLHRATSLGNLSKHKVEIVFEDIEGIKKVNTTIWAITDHNVLLKGGLTIPVHRIHSVSLL